METIAPGQNRRVMTTGFAYPAPRSLTGHGDRRRAIIPAHSAEYPAGASCRHPSPNPRRIDVSPIFRRLLLATCILLASTAPSTAFWPVWSHGYGDAWPQTSVDVVCSPAGRIILAGDFQGGIDLGNGIHESHGEYDVFLAAFDLEGLSYWSLSFGDGNNDKVRGVAADASGVYVVGDFFGSIDPGGEDLVSAGDKDVFLARFDYDGNYVWGRRFGDADYDGAAAVAVTPSGVLIAGQFRGAIDFGDGPLIAADGEDVYLAWFSHDGNHISSRRFGEVGNQRAHDLAFSGSSVFLAGAFAGAVDFGDGLHLAEDGDDAYLASFSPDLVTTNWSLAFPGQGDQRAVRVASDGAGVFLFGDFEGDIDLGGAPHASEGGTDLFLARFAPVGVLEWSRAYGGPLDQRAGGLALGPGQVFLTGLAEGSVDFGEGPLASAGGADLYLAWIDGNGVHMRSLLFGDAADQWGDALACCADGTVALAGTFAGELDLGGPPLVSSGSFDVALARYALDPSAVAMPPASVVLPVHPNPFNPRTRLAFSLAMAGPAELAVFAPDGRRVATLVDGPLAAGAHTVVWDAARQARGVYLARLKAGDRVRWAKLVLLK